MRFVPATLLLTLAALALRAFLLPSQPVSFDDFDVAISALNYAEGGQLGPTMWNHPVLRNLLVYEAMQLFGTGVLGVKGVSLTLGVACTPLLAAVARRMFASEKIAHLAAFLWTVDALAIDFSRQAINDVYLAFFPLAGIWLCYRFRASGASAWLLGAGVAFGAGLASKWSAAFPLAVTLGLVLRMIWQQARGWRERAARVAHAVALLVVVPALVYLVTFVPWFGRGYSLAELPELQHAMLVETSLHTGYRPGAMAGRDIRAYEWFVRPVTFHDAFVNLDGVPPGATPERPVTVLLAVTNPLVWLLVLPAVILLLRCGIRERREGPGYLAALFLCAYLPLVVTHRPIWLNTALSVLPFALLAVAHLVGSVGSRRVVTAYVILVLVVSAPLYVLAIGHGARLPVAGEYLHRRVLAARALPPDEPRR